MSTGDAPTRLARSIGTAGAVTIGLGSMLGAGIFAAVGPAAAAAGWGLLAGLVLAGAVAFANASSTARLAALYPESGGAYVYGRRRLGELWGYLAGSAFVAGKIVSLAAMALTAGVYLIPGRQREIAISAVAACTALNYAGVRKTVLATRVLVAAVLCVLGAASVFLLAHGLPGFEPSHISLRGGAAGVLRAGALMFFAFAGYARIATLGEEVSDPARTIPRAIPAALGATLAVYALVCVSALIAAGPERLAGAEAPLASAVQDAGADRLAPIVRLGAALASLGVLVSLLAGVGRTVFAMSAAGDLPAALGAVHRRFRVPHRAEMAVGAIVVVLAASVDVRRAIAFSSFAVLVYYAIANVSALTLSRGSGSRVLPAFGLAGCLALAFALPVDAVAGGIVVLALAAAIRAVRRASSPVRNIVTRSNGDGGER